MESTLAPIVLFVYNRPWHTLQTLEALAKNDLSDESILYIYADGPKDNVDEKGMKKIQETRACIKKKQWCKEVIILESESNLGLANSIIKGVTEIVNKYGNIIVLEDDLVTSKGFLKYVNHALALYADECRVGCIHAWNYDLNSTDIPENTFFLKGGDCWGWATWKRAWDIFNPDGDFLLKAILSKNIQYEFDRNGTHSYLEMLKAQIAGQNNSWAIRWHASLFLAKKYCLQPAKSIVKNIGLDNSGVHCDDSNLLQNPVDFINVNKVNVEEAEWFFKAYANYLDDSKKIRSINKWQQSKTFLKHLFRR